MRIVRDIPPNYAEIIKVFPVAGKPILYAYGDTIFNPYDGHVTAALQAHEEVHGQRQGGDPSLWWAQYLNSRIFRFVEELEAHTEEYRVLMSGNRRQRRNALNLITTKLASPIYGSMVSKSEARRLLEEFSI